MGYEALELFFANPEGAEALDEGTFTLVKAGSMAELLSRLKARVSTGGWRVALIAPEVLQGLLEFSRTNSWPRNEIEDCIVNAGVKNFSHSLSHYVFDRVWVRNALLRGKMPVVDATCIRSGASCVKAVRAFISYSKRYESRQVCLVAINTEILQSLAMKDLCAQPEDFGGVL